MSLAAVAAMRDLADCLNDEAHKMSGPNKALLHAMVRAHNAAASRIEARVTEANGPVEVPEEYREQRK